MSRKYTDAKLADHERRKALWKAREYSLNLTIDKEEFRKSILKISADIDSIFYGYRKVYSHNSLL